MPFQTPTLPELKARAKADLALQIGVLPSRGVAHVLASIHAAAMRGLYLHQQTLAQDLFPDTAQADALERWAGIWGVTRTPAARAVGQVVFQGQAGAWVPLGLGLQSQRNQTYTTSQSGVLATNGQATLAVRADKGGAAGNLATGSTLTLSSTVLGVEPEARVATGGLVGGAPQETDDALRARLLARIRAQERLGSVADYKAWALAVPGVDRAWAFAHYGGEAGVVAVFITVPSTNDDPRANPAKLQEVQTALDALRPAGAVLRTLTPALLPVNVQASIAPLTPPLQTAVRAELANALHQAARPGASLARSVIEAAFARVEGLTSWNITRPREATQPAAGNLPVLGTVTLRAG